VSWLLLGGKCASCKARISPRYPIVELVTALLSAAVVWRFGFHWQSVFGAGRHLGAGGAHGHRPRPPDPAGRDHLPLLWLGLLASLAWHAGLAPPRPPTRGPRSWVRWPATSLLWSVYWAFKLLTGKEGMGYGDFKLLAALGAWMGWQMLPLVLLLSAFTGAVVGIALIVARGRDRNVPIPFGPYLAAAGWIAMMWGPEIVGGYLSMTGMGR
jgi:leader peptidase (prepilin peptidase) / N-methyltransferase